VNYVHGYLLYDSDQSSDHISSCSTKTYFMLLENFNLKLTHSVLITVHSFLALSAWMLSLLINFCVCKYIKPTHIFVCIFRWLHCLWLWLGKWLSSNSFTTVPKLQLVVFISLNIILYLIMYTDNEWNFYFIFGYFANFVVPVVNPPVVSDYHPAMVVKFSLYVVILFTDMYM